jgi:hypothetical protein
MFDPGVAAPPDTASLLYRHSSFYSFVAFSNGKPVTTFPENALRGALHPFIDAQKSGWSARGTAASLPEYHLVFSAQTDSTQSPRLRP